MKIQRNLVTPKVSQSQPAQPPLSALSRPPAATLARDTFEQRPSTNSLKPRLEGAPLAESTVVSRYQGPEEAASGGRTVDNAVLQTFLAEHPEIKTAQDLINYSSAQKLNFQTLCNQLGVNDDELTASRTVNLSEYVYSGPVLAPNLQSTVTGANAFFITQFKTDTYNPDGGTSTRNCGPTSLAMALRAQGMMPEGLSPEQQIDYARGLMYPNAEGSMVEANGQQYRVLDQDGENTDISAVTAAAGSVGAGGSQATGWGALDDALASGKTVVCPGNVGSEWSASFPNPSAYHLEGDGHFMAVLGRTEDGKYLVADPLYPDGVVEMTRAQLEPFFRLNTSQDPVFAAIGPDIDPAIG
ncbi:C39 family peptidase [Corallococcus llansteffanensis]|uniref:Peptidase C39-like domain-containing protein n=1 Tax=Corallococcus llansteffanensis TaxID=2316731 RepID=A0A3A8Q2C0_9BACT|nr:C39 family peptidase [Corallococcus llansteffanensis]RKH59012.1 hypothetical protein D7V93_15720 [Corallococcus llansteffanensis]